SLRFDWVFGDGSTGSNAGATPQHVYAKAGRYSVTLTVTDGGGCSSVLVFTGLAGFCSRDPAATITRSIFIPAPPAKIGKSKIDKKHHSAKFTFRAIGDATGFQCAIVKRTKHRKKAKFSSCRSPKSY